MSNRQNSFLKKCLCDLASLLSHSHPFGFLQPRKSLGK